MCSPKNEYRTRSLEDLHGHQNDHAKWSRRSFLSTLGLGVFGTALSWNGLSVQAFSQSPLMNQLASSANDRILVLIQLSGGNDGLNTIVPVRNDVYYRKRPTIAIRREESILLSDDIGMHPAMSALRPLWDNGKMNVVHNVGYSNHSRSHGDGTDIWISGSSSRNNVLTDGWIGRYFAHKVPNYSIDPPVYPLGVRIGGSAALFESEFGNMGVTFGGASQLERIFEQGGFYNADDVPNTHYGRALKRSREVANDSFRYLDAIERSARDTANLVDYPNDSFAGSMAMVARMVRGQLGSKVFLVSRGGFDTHGSQGGAEGRHAGLVGSLADGIAAFYNDLAEDGLADKVLCMTFSEFGRTLDENASNGTDHGSSAPVMLFGPVNGGMTGEHASLLELDGGGDPVYTQDYRDIYLSILRDWFELEDEAFQDVLPGQHEGMNLIDTDIITSVQRDQIPTDFVLYPNYPNPFNPSTRIKFELQRTSNVELSIYNISGQRVRTLVQSTLSSGVHELTFDANGLPSGMYIAQLKTPQGTLTQKMSLLK